MSFFEWISRDLEEYRIEAAPLSTKIIPEMVALWKGDFPSKYSVGQVVRFFHRNGEHQGIIIGKNSIDDTVEYAVENYPYLIWEDEILGISPAFLSSDPLEEINEEWEDDKWEEQDD